MINILKRYWQYIVIVLLALALLLSVRSCKNQKELVAIEQSKTDSLFYQGLTIKLKNGQQALRIRTFEVTDKQLREENILTYVENKRLKEQGIKQSKIIAFYQGQFTMDDTFAAGGIDTIKITIHDKDTTRTKLKSFHYSNNWLTLHSEYNPLTDSIRHRYLYRADFNLVSYRRGAGLFNRGQLVTDIKFSDPNIQTGEFKGIVVKERKPLRISIGPALIYDPFAGRVTIGFGATYGIVQF